MSCQDLVSELIHLIPVVKDRHSRRKHRRTKRRLAKSLAVLFF